MSAMPPVPPHPYSGYLPRASSSVDSLRFQSEMANRNRSNTVASHGSTPVPISSGLSRGHNVGDVVHHGLETPTSVSSKREGWRGFSALQHGSSYSLSQLSGSQAADTGAWVPPSSLRTIEANGSMGSSRSGSMDTLHTNEYNQIPELPRPTHPIHHVHAGSEGSRTKAHADHHPDNSSHQVHTAHSHPPPTSISGSGSGSGHGHSHTSGIAKYILSELDQSKDEGNTLDISRRAIKTVDATDIAVLRSGVGKDKLGVWRLALSYNRLTERSFDPSFNTLVRLRYLNLKGNRLVTIPHVLLELPSLEILDVSKNELVSLPEDPGRLVQLRVLSLSYNKLRKLPGYLVHFANLRVLVVDNNPIEWPPPEVLAHRPEPIENRAAPKSSSDSGIITGPKKADEVMKLWIATIKDWMRTHEQEQVRLLTESLISKSNEEQEVTVITEPSDSQHVVILPAEEDEHKSALPWLQANMMYRSLSSETRTSDGGPLSPPPILRSEPHFGSTRKRRVNHSTQSSSELDSSTPQSSTGSSEGAASTSLTSPLDPIPPTQVTLGRNVSSSSTIKDGKYGPGHNRGSSYTTSRHSSTSLSAKKSLPDLRLSHAQILVERRSIELDSNAITPTEPKRDPLDSLGANQLARSGSVSRRMSTNAFLQMSSLSATGMERTSSQTKLGEDRSIEQARHSYFRRLSTLPVSSVSKAIPTVLLTCADGIRGLLFALSQIHTSLQQYLTFATDDRIAGVFARVLDPAAGYLNSLIDALDRFDAISRRRAPPASVIRPIIEACRDSVSVFAKVIAVLKLQVTALRPTADVRYTKTLLLMVFGSFGEVVSSWQSMQPVLQQIRPMLQEYRTSIRHRTAPSYSGSVRTPISPIPERGESQSPSAVFKSQSVMSPAHYSADVLDKGSPLRPMGMGREKSRRHAGSFSADDVQAGMMLGPDGFHSAGSSESGSKDMSLSARRPSHLRNESTATQIILEADEEEENEADENNTAAEMPPITSLPMSREGSLGRHGPSSSVGSLKSFGAMRSQLRRDGHLETVLPVPKSAATVVDDGVLDTLEQASDIAYTVWLRLSEELSEPPTTSNSATGRLGLAKLSVDAGASPRRGHFPSSPRVIELLERIAMAEETTRHLHESLMEVRARATYGASNGTGAEVRLPHDAQNFIKAVVRVSELAILVCKERPLPVSVRVLLGRLTSKTRDCGILLQVSTLKPVSAGPGTVAPFAAPIRPFSPAFGL